MISRRKIISRSKDELTYNSCYGNDKPEIWCHKEELYRDHILEVLNKWDQIEDEIWAKIIVMENNHRIAKAYARASIITINGSDVGFDGYRIGINGLGEGSSDPKTAQIKKMIGQGVKLKVDEAGNILIKRLSRNQVYVKNCNQLSTSLCHTLSSTSSSSAASYSLSSSTSDDTIVSNEIINVNGKRLTVKFTSNLEKEVKSGYPDRSKLETQCISVFSFVEDSANILDLPCYILIVNIVALDILQARLPRNGPYPSFTLNGSEERMIRFEDDRADRSIGEEIQIHVKPETDSSRRLFSRKPSSSRSRALLNLDLDDSRFLRRNKSLSIELPSPDYDDEDDDGDDDLSSVEPKARCKPNHGDDPYYSGLRAKITQPSRFDKNHFRNHSHHQNHSRNNTLLGYSRYGSSAARSKHFRSMMKKSQSTSYLDSFVSMGPIYSVSSDYSLGEYNLSTGY